ncbi:MAG: hypothetical protein JWO51_511 [Rhodospirillales bacterium]|nr:hypothetical protein [Rhodospirillales bacterium]
MSSKIPPAEWDAIAARRDKGESVAYIARTYETSPATIYGVLKKVAEARGEEAPAPEPTAPPAATAAEAPPAPVPPPTPAPAPVPTPTRLTLTSSRPQPPAPSEPAPVPAPVVATAPVEPAPPPAPPAPQQPFKFTYENRAVDPPVRQPRVPAPPRPFADVEPKTALTANLDTELRAQADAAILIFQTAFAAVLGEETVATRKELRQAASDLMRVAARTTIALERKDALVDRAAMPPMQRPRNDAPSEPGEYRQNRRPPRG